MPEIRGGGPSTGTLELSGGNRRPGAWCQITSHWRLKSWNLWDNFGSELLSCIVFSQQEGDKAVMRIRKHLSTSTAW